jgi:hypothetical protein
MGADTGKAEGMEGAAPLSVPSFPREHGLAPAVWDARGYARYADAEGLMAIDPAYREFAHKGGHPADTSDAAYRVVQTRGSVPGIAIMRRSLGGKHLPA